MSPACCSPTSSYEWRRSPRRACSSVNSGSDANDTQIKLAWYYNNAIGRPAKKKIIARHKGYHGTTLASAGLTGLPAFHKLFDLPLPGILHTDAPYFYRGAEAGEREEDYASRLASNLEKLIVSEGPDTVAAFIAEPLMGVGGVLLPPRTYFEKVQAVLGTYDILLIDDEVITGFGSHRRDLGRAGVRDAAEHVDGGEGPVVRVSADQRGARAGVHVCADGRGEWAGGAVRPRVHVFGPSRQCGGGAACARDLRGAQSVRARA